MAPFEDSSSSFAAMSRAWSQAAAKVAPDVLGLPEILQSRLDELKSSAHLDEKSLNATVEDAVKLVQKRGNKESATLLNNQLRRYVYEYLLALDAVIAKPPEPELQNQPAHAEAQASQPAAALAEVDMTPLASVAPKEGFHLTDEEPAVKQVQVESQPIEVMAEPEPIAVEAVTESFDLKSIPFEEATEETLEGGTFETASVIDLPSVEPSPIPEPEPDPDSAPTTSQTVIKRALPKHVANEWNVRRGANQARQTGASVETEVYDPTEAEITMRRDIEKLLQRKRTDFAAARVRKAIKAFPTSFMAEVALDMGDRMQILGKSRAAMNCYLAAIRCLPTYEEPFERLADLALLRRDSDLTASLLEQVADLRRGRNDVQGALRCYRKIVTIAPQRKDIAAAMLRIKSASEY